MEDIDAQIAALEKQKHALEEETSAKSTTADNGSSPKRARPN